MTDVISLETARLRRTLRALTPRIETDPDGSRWLVLRDGRGEIIAQARVNQ